MEMKVKFLKDLFRMEKNALDLVDFHPVQRNFYYYLEKSEMDKESYEKFMKDLYQEDLIDIDLCGGSDFTYAIVRPKIAAAQFIANHDGKQSIGF